MAQLPEKKMGKGLFALLLLSPFLLVLLLELGAQLLQPWLIQHRTYYYHRQYLQELAQPDALYIWSGRPRASAVLENGAGDPIAYKLNSLGWRSPEFLPYTTLINGLFLGDAFTFGVGVAEGDRYADQLVHSFPKLKVWNLAVPGYAPDQEFLQAERWLTAYPFSFLVLQISATSLEGVAEHIWSHNQAITNLPGVLSPASGMPAIFPFSEAWSFGQNAFFSGNGVSETQLQEALPRLLLALRGTLALSLERKIPALLLQASDWGASEYGAPIAAAYQEGVEKIAKELKVPLVEAPSVLTKEDFLPFPDFHWTASGQRKVALQLAPFVGADLQPIMDALARKMPRGKRGDSATKAGRSQFSK